MENKIKEKIIKLSIESGSYVTRNYNESFESIQLRMGEFDYSYNIKTDINQLRFITKTKVFYMPLARFDYMLLWKKLGDVPINDDEEIEIPFEHFMVGTERSEIWHWFEWFFDVSIGEVIMK